MQRLRLKFSRGSGLKYLSHLDLMRLWERALRRAGISLAYSEGFSPHPRISLAAPLAVGITSIAELMDVFLAQALSPDTFLQMIKPQLPEGMEISEVTQVRTDTPSLQSMVRYAEYNLQVETDLAEEQISSAISALLQKAELPWSHARDTGERHYDLRPLIDDIWLLPGGEKTTGIGMRLRCDPSGSGRPEQVARALGIRTAPKVIQRTKLIMA